MVGTDDLAPVLGDGSYISNKPTLYTFGTVVCGAPTAGGGPV